MVNVESRRCRHESCTKRLCLNVKGSKKATYCLEHANDSMMNVLVRRCSHASCTTRSSFNIEGSITGAHCKEHAAHGMINVTSRRCAYDACTTVPSRGILTDAWATVCVKHKSDILSGDVVNFTACCKVAGCRISTRWGPHGRQPTHCLRHGPSQSGLVHTVRTINSKKRRNPSCGAVRPPSFRVKTECFF